MITGGGYRGYLGYAPFLEKINLKFFFAENWKNFPKNVRLGVSICLDVVSIETLDLDVVKELVSTVEKISTASKS